MLSLPFILEVARLLDQTGEPRPGFLHDEKANLEGQLAPSELGVCSMSRLVSLRPTNVIRVAFEYVVDPKTGGLRIQRK